MNKLECMSAFIMVVQENSFAKAAKNLKVSTAAISRQITLLESTLQSQLLVRTTRRLALTEVGKTYYEQCKKIITDLNEAEMAVLGSQQEASGTLNLMCNRYFYEKVILPKLDSFLQQNPKLHIKLSIAERFADLDAEGIDIILGVSLEGPPGLVQRKIASTRYILCASPEYLKKYGTPKDPSDLTAHRYITHTMRTPNNAITFDDGQTIYLEPLLYLNDALSMRECALQGMGIVRLHDYMVNEDLAINKLIEIMPKYNRTQIPVFLYYSKRRFLLPKIRKFIDFFVS